MVKVSWNDKETNNEVLKAVGKEISIISTTRKRKKNWIGPIMRTPGLLKDLTECSMEREQNK